MKVPPSATKLCVFSLLFYTALHVSSYKQAIFRCYLTNYKKVIHYRYDTLFAVSEFIQAIYSRAIFLFNYRIIHYIYVSKHHALKYPYHILDREPCHIIRNSHITIK
jgi:hypothetical protein